VVTVAAADAEEAADVDADAEGVAALSPSSLAPRPLSVTDPLEPTLPSSSSVGAAAARLTPLTAGHYTTSPHSRIYTF